VKILVTGAGGLVGAALATRLQERGHDVAGTVRTRSAPPGVTSRSVRLEVPGDFGTLVGELRPEVVVHTAYSMAHLDRDVVAATAEVAAACDRHEVPLVAVSTDAVFDGERPPYREDDLPEPVHSYGRAKRAAELAVGEVEGAAIVRLALVTRFEREPYDAATAWLLDATRRGEPVTLFTDEVRSVIHLDDVVAGLVAITEADDRAGVWHLGGPEPLSRWELGQLVARTHRLDTARWRADVAASFGAPRPRDVTLSCDRARGALGFAPRAIGTVTGRGQANR
jgi:dTDP-4-dehydrorhamnose reductase